MLGGCSRSTFVSVAPQAHIVLSLVFDLCRLEYDG